MLALLGMISAGWNRCLGKAGKREEEGRRRGESGKGGREKGDRRKGNGRRERGETVNEGGKAALQDQHSGG